MLKTFIDMGVSLDHVHDGFEDALWVAHHFNQVEIIDFLEEVNLTPSIENDLPPDRHSELDSSP